MSQLMVGFSSHKIVQVQYVYLNCYVVILLFKYIDLNSSIMLSNLQNGCVRFFIVLTTSFDGVCHAE